MRFLQVADVVVIAAEVLARPPGDLDECVDVATLAEVLDILAASEWRCPEDAAASLFAKLARSPALSAGRLRVAWMAACQLLSLNDRNVVASDPNFVRALLNDVAKGLRVPDELAAWFNGACAYGHRRVDLSRMRAVPAGFRPLKLRNPISLRNQRTGHMFERFTPESRSVIAQARQEASRLCHNFIGTEHLLIAFLIDGEGVAARALSSFGLTVQDVRTTVTELIGPGPSPYQGQAPFTPRTKKVLELSLRHAVQLGDRGIGTEHILLGILDEGEGVAARVIDEMGISFDDLRNRLATIREERPPITVDDAALGDRLRGDLDALIGRNTELEAEVARLRAMLINLGIDPSGGAISA